MEELVKILPDIFEYLSSGFVFILGLYLIIDQRFNFFSRTSFFVMLVVGFACNNLIYVTGFLEKVNNYYAKNLIVLLISFIFGVLIAVFKNTLWVKINNLIIKKTWRKKSISKSFWYDILDSKNYPMWLRLTNNKYGYIIEGVLLSLSETEENPYLLLGYCKTFNMKYELIEGEKHGEGSRTIQKIVRADDFDYITLIYDEKSDKCVKLNILEADKEC